MGGRLDDGAAAGCGEPPCTRNGVTTEGLVFAPADVVAPAAAAAATPLAATVPIPTRAAGCTRGLGGPTDRTGVDGVFHERLGPRCHGLPPMPSVPLPPADPSPPRLPQRPGEESTSACRPGKEPNVRGGRGGGVDGVTVVGTTRKMCAAIPGDDDVATGGVATTPGGSTRNTACGRPATGGDTASDDGGTRDARLARLGGDTTAAPPASWTRRTPRADTGGGGHLGSSDGGPPLPLLPPPQPQPPRTPPQPAQRRKRASAGAPALGYKPGTMTAVGAAPMPGRGGRSATGRRSVGYLPAWPAVARYSAQTDRDGVCAGRSGGRQWWWREAAGPWLVGGSSF